MHSSDRTLLASLGFADPDKKDRRHTLACQYLAQPEVMARVLRSIWNQKVPLPFEWDEAAAVAWTKAPAPAPSMKPRTHTASVGYYSASSYESTETLTFTTREEGDATAPFGLMLSPGKIEVPITRGRNNYLIGFWDVSTKGSVRTPWAEVQDEYGPSQPCPVRAPGVMVNTPEWDRWERAFKDWVALPLALRRRSFTGGWAESSVCVCVEVKARPVDVADIARQIALYTEGSTLTQRNLVIVATCYAMCPLDRETLARKGIKHIRLGQPFDDWCKAQANVNAADGGQEF